MPTKTEQPGAPDGSPDTPDIALNRRGFLGSVAGAGIAAGLSGHAGAAAMLGSDAAAETRMPDGSTFARWERPLSFSKTYYVDNGSAMADDNGPGDQARPFRTIGKAAEILQPGERVVIASGVYREFVRPARGGTGPDRMISYEAAPGAKVFIRGSEVLKDGWHQETVSFGRASPQDPAAGAPVTVWRYDLTTALFPDNYNPFALPSVMGSWGWLDPTAADMGPYLRRRGLVFVDGKPLEPMEQQNELAMPELPTMPDFTHPPVPQRGMPPRRRGGAIMQEIGGTPTARFWTRFDGRAIYVRLASGTPADHLIEATTRSATFMPATGGQSYIRVRGLTFQHAGNPYPYPAAQDGMVSCAGGDHWIFEDNVVEWANGAGLVVGRDSYSAGAKNPGQAQIIRRNIFRYCGVTGLSGLGTTDTLVENNLVEWCGWADAERGWEAGATKFHFAKNMLYHRNVVRHIRHAVGAWWDVDNKNCRITSNVFADIMTVGAAVHMEMNPDQNQIDNNVIWDVRNAEPGTPGQRGCAGSGIFDNATSNLVIAQNLIGRCDNAGIFAIVRPDRGRPVADNNNVVGNIFTKSKASINFLDTNNKSDGNAFIGLPAQSLGLFQGTPTTGYDADAWRHIQYVDLATWQSAHGWDRHSAVVAGEIDFDPETLRLTATGARPMPRMAALATIGSDMLGKPTASVRPAGPLAALPDRGTIDVDPRRPAKTAA